MTMLDVFGYVGTLIVALSFVAKNILKLRILNLTGSIIITVYSLIVQAYPVALLNGIIILINGYQIFLFFKQQKVQKNNIDSV